MDKLIFTFDFCHTIIKPHKLYLHKMYNINNNSRYLKWIVFFFLWLPIIGRYIDIL